MKYNIAIFITVLIIPLWQIAQEANKIPASAALPVQEFGWLGCSTFSLASTKAREGPPVIISYKTLDDKESRTVFKIEATILETWFPSLIIDSLQGLESLLWSWSKDHSCMQELTGENNNGVPGTMEACTKKDRNGTWSRSNNGSWHQPVYVTPGTSDWSDQKKQGNAGRRKHSGSRHTVP